MIKKPRSYDGDEKYIFVSYSHNDSEVVYTDIAYLQNQGMRIWYDEGIPAGEDWDQVVYPRIVSSQCSGIVFFVSPSFFGSRSIAKEIEIAFNTKGHEKGVTKSFSVHVGGQSILEMMQSTIIESKHEVFHENINLIMSCFNEKRTFIKRDLNATRSYYNDILINAKRYGTIDDKNVQKLIDNEKSFKVLYVAKESSFSNAILSGINEYYAGINYVNLKSLLIGVKSSESVSDQLVKILDVDAQKFDGIILRPIFDIDKRLKIKLEELISVGKKIILVDKDLSDEQKIEFRVPIPLFVSSDFVKGGEKLGQCISDLTVRFSETSSRIILLDGPINIPSAQIRLNAMKNILQINNKEVITTSIILESFDAHDAVGMLETRFEEWLKNKELDFKNKTLIIFFGNDNIALEVSKKYHTDSNSNIRRFLGLPRNVVFMGYDGMMGHDGKIAMSSIPFDFITVNVMPVVQGREASRLMLDYLTRSNIDNGILIAPQLIKSVSGNMEIMKSKTLLHRIVDNKKLLIFDLDGTIANTEEIHWESYNIILNELDINLEEGDVKRYIGNTEETIWGMISRDYNIDIEIKSYMERRTEIVMGLVENYDILPYDYFNYVISVSGNIPKIILSSQLPEVINFLMKRWEMDDIFTHENIISVHDGKVSKDEVLCQLDKYTGLTENYLPSEVTIFEDSEHVLTLAKELGIVGIGIEHKYNRGMLEDCMHVIDGNPCRGLFIGITGLDIVHYQSHGIPKENTKSKTNDFNVYVGGPAANAAIEFSKLGGIPVLVTGIGDSCTGKALKNMLEDYGVNVIDVLEGQTDPPNTSSILVNTDNGSRTIISGQRAVNVDEISVDTTFISSMEFCLYDCNSPNIFQSFIPYLDDIPVVLDAGSFKDHLLDHLPYANEVISSAQFRIDGQGVVDLVDHYKWDFAAITNGDSAVLYRYSKDAGEILPPYVSDVVDTLGAGDVLHGAYCYFRFAKNESYPTALTSALFEASNSVRHKGIIEHD